MHSNRWSWLALPAAVLAACAAPSTEDDLPLGDRPADDEKADGTWGAALTCKTVPSLPPLANARIVVSLDGLTLHLTGDGFDKAFPIGPGRIDSDPASITHGESLSYQPVLVSGRHDFAITPGSIQPCKTWWTDPATGAKSPVFAGLPFMSWSGNYAIHGPIDNFRAPNGGALRRGFVSHGCIRMEAADVLEVYARIRGVASVPVHVQREAERRGDGSRVEVAQRWIGSECAADGDCNYAGGFCKHNRYADRGFCSARCASGCADRAGQPSTFCVPDPDDAAHGICVAQVAPQNPDCRQFDHFVARPVTRFMAVAKATACMPGSRGWVGDHCFGAADCGNGTTCAGSGGSAPGICTEACQRFCPDQPGRPATACGALAGVASCLRECTPESNASECPADSDCVAQQNPGNPGAPRFVCAPRA